MTGFKPKRFDVAGQHPDEVFGAVSDLVRVVDEVGQQTGVENVTQLWRQNRPMRHGDNLDADVQQFMAQGVRFIDGFKDKMPLGLNRSQQQVRDRCNELSGSMEKVLQKRLLESPAAKAWNYVKIKATPATVKQQGQTAVPVDKTVAAVKDILRSHFDSAWKAGIAQRTYHLWARNAEEVAETTGMYPPMPEGARSWLAFMTRVDALREVSARQGRHWAHVDLNDGIDFAQVMNFRATYRPRNTMRNKPKMRM
jgi:hypothetical protein